MPTSALNKLRNASKQIQPGSTEELNLLRGYVSHLKKHPDEGRALLVKAGIYTKTGKLSKAFGG